MNKHLQGSLLIVLAMLIFSTQSLFARFISMDTMPMLGYAELFFIITLFIFLSVRKKSALKLPSKPLLLFASGIVFAIIQISYIASFRLTTLSNAVFTHYTAPIFAFIIAVLTFNYFPHTKTK